MTININTIKVGDEIDLGRLKVEAVGSIGVCVKIGMYSPTIYPEAIKTHYPVGIGIRDEVRDNVGLDGVVLSVMEGWAMVRWENEHVSATRVEKLTLIRRAGCSYSNPAVDQPHSTTNLTSEKFVELSKSLREEISKGSKHQIADAVRSSLSKRLTEANEELGETQDELAKANFILALLAAARPPEPAKEILQAMQSVNRRLKQVEQFWHDTEDELGEATFLLALIASAKVHEWIDYDGRTCPVPYARVIQVLLRSGRMVTGRPLNFSWWNSSVQSDADIVAFRVIKDGVS
jgi:hypothetical protein